MSNLYLCIVPIRTVVHMNSLHSDENKDILYFGVKLCDINIFHHYIRLIFYYITHLAISFIFLPLDIHMLKKQNKRIKICIF